MVEKTIVYLDSAKDHDDGILLNIAAYLFDEHLDKKKKPLEKGWKMINAINIPKQENNTDCGVFCLLFAEYSSRGAKYTFNQSQMHLFREKIIYEIMKNDLMKT